MAKLLYTSDKYGNEPFEEEAEVIKSGLEECFEGLELTHSYSICVCGELTDTLIDEEDEIIAIEPEHLEHQPW